MLHQAISLRNAQVTTSGAATEYDMGGLYVSPGGGQVLAVQSIPSKETGVGSVTGIIQASASTTSTDYVTIGSFGAVTDTETPAFEQIVVNIPANARYIRHSVTVTGSPKINVAATVFLAKRVS